MSLSIWNIIGFVLALPLGIVLLAVYQRLFHPSISARYELAKVTGNQGINPKTLAFMARLISLILVPLLGLMFGQLVIG